MSSAVRSGRFSTAGPAEGEWIALSGGLSQGADRGGHVWAFLQYLAGFRELGFSVLFVDDAIAFALVPEGGGGLPSGWTRSGHAIASAARAASPAGTEAVDVPRAALGGLAERALALVNVMGFLRDGEVLARARRRVFLDIDPGYGQMWRELGLADVLAGHDAHATVGTRVGEAGSDVPDCGLDWIPSLPPVVLDQWPVVTGGGSWTSVASWRGRYGTIARRGRVYGSRVHEFQRFLDLPRRVRARFELALDIHPDETRDLAALNDAGWRLVDPRSACGDPDAYRAFVQGSRAELMVAQNMYVATRGGWFSDRSACYLASGKPVLAQDTGFPDALPTGDGLLAFSTLDEAVAGVEEIEARYNRHARAAREIAEEHLDARRVLGRLLDRAGVA